MESMVESREELVQEICSFLECAIHNILYTRSVYPASLFTKTRIYNVPVWKSRHPLLVSYIKNMVDSVRPLFQRQLVDKFCVVICGEEGEDGGGNNNGGKQKTGTGAGKRPLEQYTFSLKLLDTAERCTRASLDTFLRSFLLKINVADGSFLPLPSNSTLSFYCLVHTNSDLGPSDQHRLQAVLENPWISADEEERDLFGRADVIPFKTIATQAFILQLHVEQTL
jgi:mitotic spindle assembly checkpoint protein MAD2B